MRALLVTAGFVLYAAGGLARAQVPAFGGAPAERLFPPTAVHVPPAELEVPAPGVPVRALSDFEVHVPIDLRGDTNFTFGTDSRLGGGDGGFSVWAPEDAAVRLGFERRFGRTAFEVGAFAAEDGGAGSYARVGREVSSSTSIDISRAEDLGNRDLSMSSLAVRYRPNEHWLLSGDVGHITSGGTEGLFARARASYTLTNSFGLAITWRAQGDGKGGRHGVFAGELEFSF